MNLLAAEARQIILRSQLLSANSRSLTGKSGVLKAIEQLGYIQIDTINVIERAHHHTLFSRVGDYNQNMLDELLAKDRTIFEYWGHAMSYLPISDYRYYLPRMQNFYEPQGKWMRQQLDQAGHLLDAVKDRITEEGPLGAKDFSSDRQKGGTWWDWKPAKVALEILFWRGELMISERRKFQKVYDLTERVLPDTTDTSAPTSNEMAYFLVHRALKAMGLASEREIQKFLQPGNDRDSDLRAVEKEIIRQVIQELLETGEIAILKLEDFPDTTFFALSETIENIDFGEMAEEKIHILSPFDNLIIQRDRISRLFGFDYTLECYMPEAKRKYGYFVLPILFGDRFIGRMDAKANRSKNEFMVKSLYFEKDFSLSEEFVFLFDEEMRKFALFNNCNNIEWPATYPTRLL